jgi:Family of unknown function (DUF5906)
MGRFNGFIQSVLLRVSEARDQGEVNRYALADHLKTLIAAPPDVLRCDEKYIRAFPVPNTTAVCFTSNHALDALYIAPTSRRYYVAASEVTRDAFAVDYWRDLYAWYRAGGIGHVAAYLRTLDLSGLDPAAAPPLTAAFQTMVAGGESPDLPEMQTLLESIASPPALTLAMLRKAVDVWTPDRDDLSYSFRLWLRDHRNGNQVRHRLIEAGYRPVGNPEEKRRRWLIGKRQTAIYALESLTPNERVAAAKTLIERLRMERPERRS